MFALGQLVTHATLKKHILRKFVDLMPRNLVHEPYIFILTDQI